MMKIVRIAALSLCLALLVLPSLAIPIFRPAQSGAEYRVLADPPLLFDEDAGVNPDFAGEFEGWLSDHFAFRDAAVWADAQLNYRLLQTSPNVDVVVGRDGWLYYAESVPDYTGEGRLTDEELADISDNIAAMAEALEERGASLYVAVIPNKNTVYPQFMPSRFAAREDEGNIARLEAACAELPVTWIDLLGPLREAANADPLVYYRTDTHWNRYGACLAADALLRGMGREGIDFAIGDDERYAQGDLARLMGMPGGLPESAPVPSVDIGLPEADYALHALTVPADGDGRLLVFRDSFGTAIGPYLAQSYEETQLRWENPLEVWHECDDALILIAERNIRMYLSEPPILDEDGGEYYAEEDWEEDEWDEESEEEDFGDEDEESEEDDFGDEYSDEEDLEDGEEDDEDDYEMLQRMREEMRSEEDGF